MLIDKPDHREFLLQILNGDLPIPIKYANIAAELQVAVNLAEIPKDEPTEE